MFKESIKMAWKNIVQNKMRSFLTVLGIIIGVASIIALITIVKGATGSITDEISNLGADRISVQAMGTPLKRGLKERELNLISDIEYVNGVSPTVSGVSSVVYNKKVKEGISIQGKDEVYFKRENDILGSGRGINYLDVEYKTQVAIIGSKLANEIFLGEDPIGKKIIIKNRTFTIVGLLKPTGGFSMSSTDDVVLIPYTSAMKSLGVGNISSLDIYMSDSMKSEEIINSVNIILNEAFNYRENAFNVFNMQDMINTLGDITAMMSLLLAGIASISLVVGGIGIMNMMLVSVTERTTEIGLRKALGAEPTRIQIQFLIESIFLSLFGGILGFLVGVLIAFLTSTLMGFNFNLTIDTIVLSLGFSILVGIIFGFMPARKASKLNPIDALRHV